MTASLNEKLQRVEWGEYSYKSLFNKIIQGRRLKKDDQILGNIPFVMSGVTNAGVVNFISNPLVIFPKNSITVDIFGNVFYRDYEFSAGDDTGVYWNDENHYSRGTMLFFAISMEKSLLGKFSFGNKLRSSQSFDLKMRLPTKNGKIDFKFMEDIISELEQAKMSELEAYLQATGLHDFTLKNEEERVLSEFESGKFEWRDFRIEEVLDWQPQKEIDPLKLETLKDEHEDFYPFYGQATIDNGIISYNQLTRKVLNNENGKPTILIHSNNQNIVYLESPFYLKDGHGATSVLQNSKLNRINQMFLVSVIDKVIKLKYSYNNKATKIELKNSVVSIIVKGNQPDYELMETLISAIQKYVVRDMVEYVKRKMIG